MRRRTYTDRTVCFMARRVYGFGICVACVALLAGCDHVLGDETLILSETEAKQALRKLPYRYRFRPVSLPEGAEAAIAGTAFGPFHTMLNFGVAFGRSTDGVPVPRSGTSESVGYRETFLYTDDLQILNAKGKIVSNPAFKTAKQWHTAVDMAVEITDRLCIAVSGDHCPV